VFSPPNWWNIYNNIYTNVVRHTEKAHAQTAHLVFADPKANAEKPKELFFANADEIKTKK
jgi:hypothetical protein